MKYAYVVFKEHRSVTMVDLTDKITIDLCEYEEGDFDKGLLYTWDMHKVETYIDYAELEELVSQFAKADIIIPSDFLLQDICKKLKDSQYKLWESSCDICFGMLEAYKEHMDVAELSLEDLIKQMQ